MRRTPADVPPPGAADRWAADQWLDLLSEPAALVANPEGIVIAANARFAALLGCDAGALTGAGLSRLVGAGDTSRLRRAMADRADSTPVTLHFSPGGGTRAVAMACHFGPVQSGRRLLRVSPPRTAPIVRGTPVRGTAGRVRQLERQVEELGQKLTWFREAMDKVGHHVVIFDKRGRLVLCNKIYRDGYRVGDRDLPADVVLEGKTYRELMELRVRYKLHKEFAEEPDKFIEDRMRRFEAGTDHTIYLGNGTVIRTQYRRLADGMGGYIGTDITELVRTEQRQLATEHAYRTKSQFLANMSHELRTPLNAILGFSELIRDATAGPVAASYRDYADDIHAAGQHLLNLINDILDLSKIEVGFMQLREGTVDVADIVRKCCRLVHQHARENHQTIAQAIPLELPCLRADELRLKQIVLNLLSNAIKFTPSGGLVRIAAACRPDGGLDLSVADSGIGMRPEDIATALTPFQQIEQEWRRGRDGSGLGLPLAKTLTELHGARFVIESMPGIGTTVTISMPPERVLRSGAWPARLASVQPFGCAANQSGSPGLG